MAADGSHFSSQQDCERNCIFKQSTNHCFNFSTLLKVANRQGWWYSLWLLLYSENEAIT